MSSITRKMGALGTAALIAITASGCGSSPQQTAVDMPAAETISADQPCFGELTPAQQAELATYAASNGDRVAQLANDSGVSDESVCILQSDNSGNLTAHYYEHDEAESHFSQYLLMSMLLRQHSSTILTYGVLTGDIGFGEAMALQMLFGYNNRGAYPIYDRGTEGSWVRNERPRNYGTYVSQVQYGKQAPKPVEQAVFAPKPAGFNTWGFTAPTQRVGTFDKSGVVKLNPSLSAAGFKKLATTTRVPTGYVAPKPAYTAPKPAYTAPKPAYTVPKPAYKAPAPAKPVYKAPPPKRK